MTLVYLVDSGGRGSVIRGVGSCQEVGAIGNGKIVPEVARIKWGWGWYSVYPCILGSDDVTVVGGNGVV